MDSDEEIEDSNQLEEKSKEEKEPMEDPEEGEEKIKWKTLYLCLPPRLEVEMARLDSTFVSSFIMA